MSELPVLGPDQRDMDPLDGDDVEEVIENGTLGERGDELVTLPSEVVERPTGGPAVRPMGSFVPVSISRVDRQPRISVPNSARVLSPMNYTASGFGAGARATEQEGRILRESRADVTSGSLDYNLMVQPQEDFRFMDSPNRYVLLRNIEDEVWAHERLGDLEELMQGMRLDERNISSAIIGLLANL
jgi:hypothetical protein